MRDTALSRWWSRVVLAVRALSLRPIRRCPDLGTAQIVRPTDRRSLYEAGRRVRTSEQSRRRNNRRSVQRAPRRARPRPRRRRGGEPGRLIYHHRQPAQALSRPTFSVIVDLHFPRFATSSAGRPPHQRQDTFSGPRSGSKDVPLGLLPVRQRASPHPFPDYTESRVPDGPGIRCHPDVDGGAVPRTHLRSVLATVEAWASSRLGLLTLAEARAFGLRQQAVSYHRRPGRKWRRVFPEVYEHPEEPRRQPAGVGRLVLGSAGSVEASASASALAFLSDPTDNTYLCD
jgi:hypothetical protein